MQFASYFARNTTEQNSCGFEKKGQKKTRYNRSHIRYEHLDTTVRGETVVQLVPKEGFEPPTHGL